MTKNYYKIAIIFYAVQLILLTVLINNMLMSKFNFFQPASHENIELLISIFGFILNAGAIFIIRYLYLSSLRTHLKFKHIAEQNKIYRQHHHDLKNQLSTISGLAQTNELERLKNYLSAYLAIIDKSIISVNTGLNELDTLFYAKFAEAKRKNIDISFECFTTINSKPQCIINLVSILANAIDNAIEACENIEGLRVMRLRC